MALSTDDLTEIQHLYAQYNTAIDTGAGADFGACYVEDGYFNSGMSIIEGRPGLEEFAVQTHTNLPAMRHNATNIVVKGDGQTATGSAFLIGYTVNGGYKVIVTGRYQDELVKTPEGWRFSRRVFEMDQ